MAALPFFKKKEPAEPKIFSVFPSATPQAGRTTLRDIVAPAALEISPSFVRLGEKFVRTLFVFSYPRYLHTNWFSPIINLDKVFDISFFIHPVDTALVLRQLRKQVTRVQSQISMRQEKGLVRDPVLDTAHRDLEELRDKLQQAREKLFNFGLYISLYGASAEELDKIENEIRSVLESRLVYVKPALFQQAEGFNSALPLNTDELVVHSYLPSGPISSTFPFVSFDLTSSRGILYGINRHNNSLILFDRWSLENANSVTFAVSGAGKSIAGSEPVLIRRKGIIDRASIGTVIEHLIRTHGITYRDEELEGVSDPGIEVYSFDRNLSGQWSRVTVAARKKGPADLYRLTTRSGRAITTTGEHNLVVLRNGRVVTAKSTDVAVGEYLPLPRRIAPPANPNTAINLLTLLEFSPRIYIRGAEQILSQHYRTLTTTAIDERYDRYLYKYRDGRAIPIAYFCKLLRILGRTPEASILPSVRITASQRRGTSLPTHLPLHPSLFRLLGYITAEGTVAADTVLISNRDPEVLTDIRTALREIGVSYFQTAGGVVIPSRVFAELVKKLGAGGYAGEKRVPPLIFGADRDLIAAYLQAYFEGDGGVEYSSISAVSKSQPLISDIAYLLYYFGIVGRITPRRKRVPRTERKRTYWLLSISGQENLRQFERFIYFVSAAKRGRLTAISHKAENTNVDVIPTADQVLQDIYTSIPALLRGIPGLTQLRLGYHQPSRQMLQRHISAIEERIRAFREQASCYGPLGSLPLLATIIERGGDDTTLNRMLWRELGQSWRLMKNLEVRPGAKNVLRALSVINGQAPSWGDLKTLVHTGFNMLGLPMAHQPGHLRSAIAVHPAGDARYETIHSAAQVWWKHYQEYVGRLPEVERKLALLKALAHSDLFWDPIVKIGKLKNRRRYVYDLTVDNEVFLAGNGGLFVHNSYAAKLEVLRSLMVGADVIIIDPEREYQYLAETVGGAYFNVSLTSPNHINPFDLPTPREDEAPSDVLRSNIINLIGFFRILLGGFTPEEDSILDRAITETYAARDITPETDFAAAVPPTIADLALVLANTEGGGSLAARLKKYTEGTWAGFLNQQTNLDIKNRLVVFSVRDMEEELRPVAMYIVLHYIWNIVRTELKKRLLVVDEAWWLMRHEDGASFLYGIAKRARKYFLGLSTITQDVADFMTSPYGKPIVTNSSMQLLLKQSPATIKAVVETFNLTDEEKFLLLECEVGEGIFFAGLKHVAIKVIASYTEDQVITSDPAQLLLIKKAKDEFAKAHAGA